MESLTRAVRSEEVAMKPSVEFPGLFVCDHPLIQHKLTHMRNKETPTQMFRQLLREIALLMGYEVTRALPLGHEVIQTPVVTMNAPVISGKKLAVVPILRAGSGMADGLLELVPGARVGHIGLVRDHVTLEPHEYLVKLPDAEGRTFILVDPMLGTGGSAVHAVRVLNRHGVSNDNIIFMALVAAPEGMKVFTAQCAGVRVYVASLDDGLNEDGYIFPGLGDAGDRMFGTK